MARILVLGGAGEMGSVAVRDLVEHTDHEIVIADLRPEAATKLADELDSSSRVSTRVVDVEDDRSLREAMAGVDTVLTATYMRWNVRVTRAAIEAGVHLVDLGAYVADTAEQLAMDEQAREAGCRIVPGCGVAPGLTNVLAAHGARQLDQVESIRIYSYITHPITTSPGIVYTRFDASRGVSLVYRDGRLEEHPSFGEEEAVEFPPPYGTQLVHLVPHPEPLTLPKYLDVRNVVFKVGYPEEDTRLLRAMLDLGLDSADPFPFAGTEIVPRDFVAAFVGRRGLEGRRTANVKRVIVEGTSGGERTTLVYDFAVEAAEGSASSVITGTVAAIAADLITRRGAPGVRPPEAAFDPGEFLEALNDRHLGVEWRLTVGVNDEPARPFPDVLRR
jgi:saccharopine dehydrogenase-like NADP-dependent oxidoreductase